MGPSGSGKVRDWHCAPGSSRQPGGSGEGDPLPNQRSTARWLPRVIRQQLLQHQLLAALQTHSLTVFLPHADHAAQHAGLPPGPRHQGELAQAAQLSHLNDPCGSGRWTVAVSAALCACCLGSLRPITQQPSALPNSARPSPSPAQSVTCISLWHATRVQQRGTAWSKYSEGCVSHPVSNL